MDENKVNLTIDGKEVSVPKGTTVYHAAKEIGIDLPIFCYHDRMPPFGACRMCLVEVEKMPRLATSCSLEAGEGMVVHTQSEQAVAGRKSIIEFLLANHPLDCPICDQGGECPLQENALDHGPGESRFVEDKRKKEKRVALGSTLMLDKERCIVCARCTRFGEVIAGDHALELIERGWQSEVGTPDNQPVESKFIGNTIKICPVGALTSQVYRFRARPWDNESVESTCTFCSVGCSMSLDSRDGELTRTRSVENPDVNDIWLCDKGWFGYEFASHPERLTSPMVRKNGKLVSVDWKEALDLVAHKLQEAKPKGKLAGLGGRPLTVEENYLFQKLMRQVAGVSNVDHRVGTPALSLEEEGWAPGMESSITELERLDYAVLFGANLTEEFPLLWLRLRQAINKGAKVLFVGATEPEIAPYLTQTLLVAPGKEVDRIEEIQAWVSGQQGKGSFFVGPQFLHSSNRKGWLNEISKLKKEETTLHLLEGKGNDFGARLAGMRPDLGPLGEKLEKSGLSGHEVIEQAAQGGWDFLYVAGANPAMKFSKKLWEQARLNTQFLVVQDLFLNETAAQADVVLPSLAFVEKGGHFVNLEGRVQKIAPGKTLPQGLLSDGEIFTLLGQKLDVTLSVDPEFVEALQQEKINLGEREPLSDDVKEKRTGLTLTLSSTLFDRSVRMQHAPQTGQYAKEPFVRVHPEEAKKRNISSGASIEIKNEKGSFQAKVKVDPKVALETVVVPLGFPEVPVFELGSNLLNGMEVEIC